MPSVWCMFQCAPNGVAAVGAAAAAVAVVVCSCIRELVNLERLREKFSKTCGSNILAIAPMHDDICTNRMAPRSTCRRQMRCIGQNYNTHLYGCIARLHVSFRIQPSGMWFLRCLISIAWLCAHIQTSRQPERLACCSAISAQQRSSLAHMVAFTQISIHTNFISSHELARWLLLYNMLT